MAVRIGLGRFCFSYFLQTEPRRGRRTGRDVYDGNSHNPRPAAIGHVQKNTTFRYGKTHELPTTCARRHEGLEDLPSRSLGVNIYTRLFRNTVCLALCVPEPPKNV